MDARLEGGQHTIHTACSASAEQLDAGAQRLDSFAVGVLCRHSKQLNTSCGFGTRQHFDQVSILGSMHVA